MQCLESVLREHRARLCECAEARCFRAGSKRGCEQLYLLATRRCLWGSIKPPVPRHDAKWTGLVWTKPRFQIPRVRQAGFVLETKRVNCRPARCCHQVAMLVLREVGTR
jgi:hypothetical protein